MWREYVPNFRNIAKVGLSFSGGAIVGTATRFYECMKGKNSDERILCLPEERAIAVAYGGVLICSAVVMYHVVCDEIADIAAKLDALVLASERKMHVDVSGAPDEIEHGGQNHHFE